MGTGTGIRIAYPLAQTSFAGWPAILAHGANGAGASLALAPRLLAAAGGPGSYPLLIVGYLAALPGAYIAQRAPARAETGPSAIRARPPRPRNHGEYRMRGLHPTHGPVATRPHPPRDS